MDLHAQRNSDPQLPPKLTGFQKKKKRQVGVGNSGPTYPFNH